MKKQKDYGKANEQNLKIVVGLYRSHLRLNRSAQRLLALHDLTVAQFGVLEALYHLGDMKIGDIIEKTLSTSGNMTVVIRNLEQEGLVLRYSDPADGRACMVSLTGKGKALIDHIFPEHLEDLAQTLGNLEMDEKDELIRLLKKMSGI